MKEKYTLVAPCFFGMEKMLSKEIKSLGFKIIKTEDGRVTFEVGEKGIQMANIWLRCAERVHILVDEFEAKSFDDLYEQTKRIDWKEYIPIGGKFPVKKAASIRSKLASTPDIQSIVKKAIVDKIKYSYDIRGLVKEDKEEYPIFVFINKDRVSILLDTSGSPLHKRGYREVSTKAPIRETLASGLINLSDWYRNNRKILVDPMCGSGTIPIEAAMIKLNMAPGLNREFISEKWRTLDKNHWWDVRKEAFEKIREDLDFKIYGFDIDKEAIEIAKENAEIAGVDEYIEFKVADVRNFKSDEKYGVIITNPPYGERLEDEESVKSLYRDMGYRFRDLKTWSYYIITSYKDFEREFGESSTKNRKLYNGMLESRYYQYIGPKPPRDVK